MPPEENKEVTDGADSAPSGKTDINLEKILLPKKETPGTSTDSAQRINAGALLDQEQKAELPKPEKAPAPSAPKPVEEVLVKPLQTFQGDIEKVVQQKNVSVVSMAAAEAGKREETPLPALEKKFSFAEWQNTIMIVGGAILLVVAVGLIAYFFIPRGQVAAPQAPTAHFIVVDDARQFALPELQLTRDTLMRDLAALRDTFSLSLGLVANVEVGIASTSGETRILTTQEFLSRLTPRIPADLLRTLEPEYLLGIHSYDGNQSFLLLRTESYERAFAGMLEWEYSMQGDLRPLFERKVPVRPLATSTGTNATVFLNTDFVDRIVENHDARVIQNEYKDILLLWTFLDRRTILIATNDATVREMVRRLKEVPIITVP